MGSVDNSENKVLEIRQACGLFFFGQGGEFFDQGAKLVHGSVFEQIAELIADAFGEVLCA